MKRITAILITLLTVTGCGFQPLYGHFGARSDALNNVYIQQINGRDGQALRNNLIDRFYTDGEPETARFMLKGVLKQFGRSLDVQKNDRATRAQLILRFDYELLDRKTGQVIHKAQVRDVNSYNILDSQFTTNVSRDDARSRSLKAIADKLENRLVLVLQRYEAEQSGVLNSEVTSTGQGEKTLLENESRRLESLNGSDIPEAARQSTYVGN